MRDIRLSSISRPYPVLAIGLLMSLLSPHVVAEAPLTQIEAGVRSPCLECRNSAGISDNASQFLVLAQADAGAPQPAARSLCQRKLTGQASFYGLNDGFHGRKTASGKRFNAYGLTAAHKTLPLGSQVTVTNKANGKSVTVTVNDRGPYIPGRIIDLSYGAARAINMVNRGVAQVDVCLSQR